MNHFLICIFLLISCNNTKNASSDKIEGYQIYRSLPMPNAEGAITQYDTGSIQVYYYKNLTLMKLYYYYTNEDENGVITIENELRNRFLVFKNGESYGYDFDTRNKPEKTKVVLDSTLKNEWVVRNDLSGLFKNFKVTLVENRLKGDSLVRVYKIYEPSSGKPVADCQLKYSKKIPPIGLSICKQLDTVNNMKLYYYTHTINPEFIRGQGITSGEFRSEYHLSKINVKNHSEIYRYFESF
jgi:hypothetical protein